MPDLNSQPASIKSKLLRLLLIIVPVFLAIAISCIGFLFFDAWQIAPAKKVLSPKELAENEETNRLTLLTRNNPPSHNGLKDIVKRCQERLPLNEDLISQIDQVEEERCKQDPHLAKALGDHESTPLASSSPRLRKYEMENRSALYSILVEDYSKHSIDSDLLRAQLIPVFEGVLNTTQADRRQLLPELENALTSSSDPVLTYLIVMLREADRVPIALQALDSLKLRPVHPYIRMQIARLAIEVQVPTLQRGKACEEAIKSVSEFFRRHSDLPVCIDVGFYYLEWIYHTQNEDTLAALTNEMFRVSDSNVGEGEIPKTVLTYCLASICKRIAMTHRGGQFLSNVSQDQLQLFDKYIRITSSYMLKSWLSDPNRALFAAELLNVEIRSGGTGRSVDQWFRHALSSQLDFPAAVDRYFLACQSKWGGSNEKLVWLASRLGECVEIECDLFTKMQSPAIELFVDNNRERLLSDASLVKSVSKIVDYLAEQKQKEPDSRINERLTTILAKVLWDGAEFERLHRFLQSYSHLTSEVAFAQYDLSLSLVTDVCATVNIDTLKAWQVVHRDLFLRCHLLTTNDTEKLTKILDRLDGMTNDEFSRRAIARCKSVCGQVSRFQSGEQVKLDFQPDGSNWIMGGKYQILDDNAIELTTLPNARDRLLTALPRFSLPYRIEATIEMTLDNPDMLGIALQTCSMSTGMQNSQSGMLARFVPRMDLLQWDHVEPGYYTMQRCVNYRKSSRSLSAQLFIEMTENTAIGGVGGYDFEMVNGNFKNNGLVIIGREAMATTDIRPEDLDVKYKISNVFVTKLY